MSHVFNAQLDFQEKLLSTIQDNLGTQDFFSLKTQLEPAAVLDETCSFERLIFPLTNNRFPEAVVLEIEERFKVFEQRLSREESLVSTTGDYKWCIEEFIGVDGVKDQPSLWIRLYIIALHTYCDRIEPSILSTDFLLLMMDNINTTEKDKVDSLFMDYIEWLTEYVPKSSEYDDYFLLFSWLLLSRLHGNRDGTCFVKVKNQLISRKYARAKLEALAGNEKNLGTWLRLHETTPLNEFGTDLEYKTIILGAN